MNPTNLNDEELVALIREKDKEQYSEIIRRYKTKLAHYLRKFINNPDELEDVLQDVFIKVYKNLYGFNIRKKFSPWIYRISHNEAINHLKKRSTQSISLEENEIDVADEKMDIKQTIEVSLLKTKIEKGLSSLKDKYRQAIILYYFEEKSYEEISEILRIPTSTVGTLISRGKDNLKKYLQT